jgi:hypothetical protein
MWKTNAIAACGRALTMETCHRLRGRFFGVAVEALNFYLGSSGADVDLRRLPSYGPGLPAVAIRS